MDTCPQCDTQLPEDSLFCPRCGAPNSGDFDELLASSASDPTGLLDRVRAATAGEFTIIRELGRGGMGRVYLAHEIALERRVAMKVLPPELAEHREIVERFEREARMAGKLSHPNIVPVYQVLERAGLNFFTMPYVAGPSLRQILRQTPQLSVEECRRYLEEAAAALAYAHSQGVIHRDIKPENMLLEGSRDGWLLLTDFGIAKALGAATTLTRPGDMMGTPYYMSPEQCEDAGDIDGRSDQYSLGLVAYEMLAGRFPFTAESLAGIVYKHLHEYPESLEKVRPDVPLDLRQAIDRAIRKKRDERFPSMSAMLEALGTRSAHPIAIGKQLPAPPRRRVPRRLGWVAALALGTAAVAAVGFALSQRLTSPPGPGEPQLAEIEVPPIVAGGEDPVPGVVTDTSASQDDGGTGRESGEPQGVSPASPPGIDGGRDDEPEAVADPVVGDEGESAERRQAEQAGEAARYSRQAALDVRADSIFPQRFSIIDEQFANAESALEAGRLVQAALALSSVRQEFENLAGAAQRRLDEAAAATVVDPEPAPIPPEAAIRSLIETYRAALEAEDLERLASEVYRRAIPEEDAHHLGTWIERADELSVSIEIETGPDVADDRAQARVRQDMKYSLSSTHEEREFDLSLRMFFRRMEDGWRLERIEPR